MSANLVIADFDDTLIKVDSFQTILKKERWFLKPSILFCGFNIIRYKGSKKEYQARSAIKKELLKLYQQLPDTKKKYYISYFQSQLNNEVIDSIKEKDPTKVIIVSASEEELIKEVLKESLPIDLVIANRMEDIQQKNFHTCYGKEKIRRFQQEFTNYKDYKIFVYTDSYSDQPLMDIAQEVYLVKKGEMLHVKTN